MRFDSQRRRCCLSLFLPSLVFCWPGQSGRQLTLPLSRKIRTRSHNHPLKNNHYPLPIHVDNDIQDYHTSSLSRKNHSIVWFHRKLSRSYQVHRSAQGFHQAKRLHEPHLPDERRRCRYHARLGRLRVYGLPRRIEEIDRECRVSRFYRIVRNTRLSSGLI